MSVFAMRMLEVGQRDLEERRIVILAFPPSNILVFKQLMAVSLVDVRENHCAN